MLVAYGPDGQPVVAEEIAPEQLHRWSQERLLYCPNCRGLLHVRGGPDKRIQLHFAHQRGECAWGTEAESVRHARGKIVLAQWLRLQFPGATVTLEERLPTPNRIADIFVVHSDEQQWAIEFQCAPLDLEEWKHRHDAYRKAGILDVWVIGNNRREKQEAFIEAIIASAQEIVFLDPLVAPARIWLRWPVTYEMVREWQRGTQRTPAPDGWVGRLGYGATLVGQLAALSLGDQGRLIYPARSALENRSRLLHLMSTANVVDEGMLATYLRQSIDEEMLRVVVIPLVHAYQRDPHLLRRYNYGRGQPGQPLREQDRERVQKARLWLAKVAQQGFPPATVQEMVKEIPFVGPYAAFVGYIELLLALAS
jgi:hypothetical protein